MLTIHTPKTLRFPTVNKKYEKRRIGVILCLFMYYRISKSSILAILFTIIIQYTIKNINITYNSITLAHQIKS
jgi:hypothetical protein